MRLHTHLLLLTGFLGFAQAADSTVTPLGLVLGSDTCENLAFELRPMGLEPGYKLHLLITGQDFAQFKEDSLVLTEIVDSTGANRTKLRTGAAAYELGSFPQVSEDGTKAVFTIDGKADLLGKSDSLKVTGSITLLTGTEVIEGASEPLPAAGPGKATVNGYAVSTGKTEGALMFGGDERLAVHVKGNLAGIVSITATRDGTELDTSGSMTNDDTCTYFFDGKPEGAIVVTIRTWKDLKEVVVPFTCTVK